MSGKPIPDSINVESVNEGERSSIEVVFSVKMEDSKHREEFRINLVRVQHGVFKWPDEGLPLFNEKSELVLRKRLRKMGFNIHHPE